MPFDQWLQSKMTQHDFSKYRIAKMAGVHQSTVAGWLSGSKPQPQKEELVRQAMREYENSKESDLTGDEKGKENTPTGESDGRDAVLMELMGKLTAAEKEIVIAQLTGLVQGR